MHTQAAHKQAETHASRNTRKQTHTHACMRIEMKRAKKRGAERKSEGVSARRNRSCTCHVENQRALGREQG
eukprot:2769503-Pleurochrysis_carterae.AAC.2